VVKHHKAKVVQHHKAIVKPNANLIGAI